MLNKMAAEEVPGLTDVSSKNPSLVDKSERYRVIAAASFALIVLAVGLPLWWKTTEVHRVPLPYDEIHSLNDLKINFPVRVTIVVFDESIVVSELLIAKSKIQTEISDAIRNTHLDVSFHWNVRAPFDEESQIFRSSSTVNEIDEKLYKNSILPDVGSIKVVVLSSRSPLLEGAEFFLGKHRVLFTSLKNDVHSTCQRVVSVVKQIVNPSGLQKIHDTIQGRKREMLDKTSMRTLPSSSEVDVTFTLILPEAFLVDLDWNIERATHDYLDPFKERIEQIVKLNIKSQVFYLTYLDISPHYNSERNHYVLGFDRLPHIVNPIESKLGSYISTNPSLNFVVYVPPEHQSPLSIYTEDGLPSVYNSFLIPRWGGFHVHNIDRKDLSAGNATIDVEFVMGVFLAQLRLLLGIPNRTPSDAIVMSTFDGTNLHHWELDNAIRARVVENLVNSVSTLTSLAQLLEEIRNIVISDHVGEQVYRSVETIVSSCNALRDGNLELALSLSKESFVSSELAFFDPSMLALLYFPEEEKYAVYVPLFLPVSLPLLLSVVQILKWLKRRRQKGAEHVKTD